MQHFLSLNCCPGTQFIDFLYTSQLIEPSLLGASTLSTLLFAYRLWHRTASVYKMRDTWQPVLSSTRVLLLTLNSGATNGGTSHAHMHPTASQNPTLNITSNTARLCTMYQATQRYVAYQELQHISNQLAQETQSSKWPLSSQWKCLQLW